MSIVFDVPFWLDRENGRESEIERGEREREREGKKDERRGKKSLPAYQAEAAAADSASGVAASTAAARLLTATTLNLARESRRKNEGGCGQSSEASGRECLRRRREA